MSGCSLIEMAVRERQDLTCCLICDIVNREMTILQTAKERPVYVAVDEKERVAGYAFCVIRKQPFSNNMVPFTSMFIDDLCVDQTQRGQKIGEQLFEYVKAEAKRLGCYEVTLNVWNGNDSAMRFYEKMGMRPKETQMEYILR